ncbi:hypothetical protein GCM10012275_62680 [Longimycelium tulufanense]|uniref:Uncharacterized protein n=1 Tax=Longimycelium tulufanense TaxID=907463 RepID=A0A8J3FZT2_9PSEU|nr:hypothetical protein GCM10012275_62680 [Longimycelium tulufanense]
MAAAMLGIPVNRFTALTVSGALRKKVVTPQAKVRHTAQRIGLGGLCRSRVTRYSAGIPAKAEQPQ